MSASPERSFNRKPVLCGKVKNWLSNPPFGGLLLLFYLAVIVRFALAALTTGTSDVSIWTIHVISIEDQGLIEYYKSSLGSIIRFNHPPLTGEFMRCLYLLSQHFDIEFGVFYRTLFGLSDFWTAFLLFQIFKEDTRRIIYPIVYLLCPLTFLMSSYHGNTDSLIGLFALWSLLCVSQRRYAIAGLLLGIGVSVKWIILLLFPAFMFAIPGSRNKLSFGIGCVAAIGLGYGWWFVLAPQAILDGVFMYRGNIFYTSSGQPIWGNQVFLRPFLSFCGLQSETVNDILNVIFRLNNLIIGASVLSYSWLRRRFGEARQIGMSIAVAFSLFYGLTNYWAFQYLAWAIPFYVFLPRILNVLVLTLTSVYIYFLYSYLCGSMLLFRRWDFIGHGQWPTVLLMLRNACILLFIWVAVYCFIRACVPGMSKTQGDVSSRLGDGNAVGSRSDKSEIEGTSERGEKD